MSIIDLNNLLKETSKLKVLYVEDNEETRKFTLKMLQNFFSDIVISVNGLDGFEKFQDEHFDLIFTDINMPMMNGLEMIKNIRTLNKNTPIIIFSAYDDVEYFLTSIKYGIAGYILKPFNYEQIEETLLKVVNTIVDNKKELTVVSLEYSFYWDTENEILYKKEKKIILTKSETLFFRLLSSKYKTIYSTIDIELAIFDDNICDARRIRNLLSRLKRKLGCELIESIYGEGYRLKYD